MPGPCLVGVKQPVPEVDQGGQVLDRADRPPGLDAAQEQQQRGRGAQAGRVFKANSLDMENFGRPAKLVVDPDGSLNPGILMDL